MLTLVHVPSVGWSHPQGPMVSLGVPWGWGPSCAAPLLGTGEMQVLANRKHHMWLCSLAR